MYRHYTRCPEIMNIVSVICENSAVKVPFAEKVISLISVNSVITRGVDIKFTV